MAGFLEAVKEALAESQKHLTPPSSKSPKAGSAVSWSTCRLTNASTFGRTRLLNAPRWSGTGTLKSMGKVPYNSRRGAPCRATFRERASFS